MKDQSVFHVYALKDPRSNPSLPFHIGKGARTRAGDSELIIDQSTKGDRIRQIYAAGLEVLTGNLVEGLSEVEALSKRRTDQCICGGRSVRTPDEFGTTLRFGAQEESQCNSSVGSRRAGPR